MNRHRRCFLAHGALLATGALLPLCAAAQWGVVHELSGEVLLNGRPMLRHHAIEPGQTVSTGADGRVWFSVAGDAFFLRPGSELRLRPATGGRDSVVEALRLVSGALGATFSRGARRTLITQTVTIGIRGTGIYVRATPEETYACTCFGAVELSSATGGAVHETLAGPHVARRVTPAGATAAPLADHTSEEIARLERLVGRPNPF